MQFKFGISKGKPIFQTYHVKILLKSTTKKKAQINKQNLENGTGIKLMAFRMSAQLVCIYEPKVIIKHCLTIQEVQSKQLLL